MTFLIQRVSLPNASINSAEPFFVAGHLEVVNKRPKRLPLPVPFGDGRLPHSAALLPIRREDAWQILLPEQPQRFLGFLGVPGQIQRGHQVGPVAIPEGVVIGLHPA